MLTRHLNINIYKRHIIEQACRLNDNYGIYYNEIKNDKINKSFTGTLLSRF